MTGAKTVGIPTSPKVGLHPEMLDAFSYWDTSTLLNATAVLRKPCLSDADLRMGCQLTGPCATLTIMMPIAIASTMNKPMNTAAMVLNRESSACVADRAESSRGGSCFSSEIVLRESQDRGLFSRSMAGGR